MWNMDTWAERLSAYAQLMRLDRPIGTLLLLWPTLWALWIAGGGRPDPYIVAVFLAGVFLMRSAGCVINDYADRDFDPHVERTRSRPLASGRVSPAEALALFALLGFVALALVLTLNRPTQLFAVFGAVLAASYPFLKRYTHLPQLGLGVAFSMGVPMAFTAHQGTVPPEGWWLMAANLLWVVAYDTMYAMTDRADDMRVGVKSTAILFGRRDRLFVALFQAGAVVLLWQVGNVAGLGGYFRGGVVCATLFALYQQYLIRARAPTACFTAFLNNTWFGAAVWAGIVLAYLSTKVEG
jgi:4-hydroxybenzoate polyprenyltransferase